MMEDKNFIGTLIWIIIIVLGIVLVYIVYNLFWATVEEVEEGISLVGYTEMLWKQKQDWGQRLYG